MSRKTVGVNKGIKQLINKSSNEGESVDKLLSRLMDDADEPQTIELDGSRANISISEETFYRLNKFKLFSTESHMSVIFRLISEKGISE